MITFDTPDGKTGQAFFLEAKDRSGQYLFVFHEWWGLNDHIKKEAENWFYEFAGTVNVVAPDLYDGAVANTAEGASELRSSMKTKRATAIVEGALNMAKPNSAIATIGWCFGGGWSLQTAIMAGENAKACVIYYGRPEKDVGRLKLLKASVLGIFAKQDPWITPEVVNNFKANMVLADNALEVRMYDAGHAFANPSNPDYDEEATKDAHQLAVAFIKNNFHG